MACHDEALVRRIEDKAREMRVIALEMIHRRKAGHPGGSLSAAEIVAALYFGTLKVDPGNPRDPDRDRFILSKGHASAVLYVALAERGFFPKEDLLAWGELDCHLQGHPDRLKTPGVDMTSGVLGHGVGVGAGLALAARMTGRSYRTYVLLGDGECQCGVVWEGFMTAAKYRLGSLTLIVDRNDVQLDGFVHDVMPLEPLADKARAFNLAVREIDGHNVRQILEALDESGRIHDRPTLIIARTVKGKGVSFMENSSAWHGAVPSDQQLRMALEELRAGGTA
jgi:transketolase